MVVAVGALLAQAQFAPAVAEWNRVIEPFRVAGNVYYVGVADVSAFLITTPKGHFLLDAGFIESAPIIESNIAKLGFKMSDVKMLLISHAHYDHVAGMAAIMKRTAAQLWAMEQERGQLLRGGKGDFAFGDKYPFPPVTPTHTLHDGETLNLGGVTMTAHLTPGHTRGCTTWTTAVNEGGKRLNVVIPCSISAPGYQLIGNTKYPEILDDYERSFAKLLAMPCDIHLSLHSWDFDLHKKLKAWRENPAVNPFIDGQAFVQYVERGRAAARASAAKQRGGKSR